MLISRRREAKRRALLQMLDRIAVRTPGKSPRPRVTTMPLDAPLAAESPARDARPPRLKQ
ncbi:MAG TPA: hypothetical protein VF211_05975 [Burkholderiales bacterium]